MLCRDPPPKLHKQWSFKSLLSNNSSANGTSPAVSRQGSGSDWQSQVRTDNTACRAATRSSVKLSTRLQDQEHEDYRVESRAASEISALPVPGRPRRVSCATLSCALRISWSADALPLQRYGQSSILSDEPLPSITGATRQAADLSVPLSRPLPSSGKQRVARPQAVNPNLLDTNTSDIFATQAARSHGRTVRRRS